MTAQIHDATFHLVNKNRALTLTNRMFLIAEASLEIAGLGQLVALHYVTYRYMKCYNLSMLDLKNKAIEKPISKH